MQQSKWTQSGGSRGVISALLPTMVSLGGGGGGGVGAGGGLMATPTNAATTTTTIIISPFAFGKTQGMRLALQKNEKSIDLASVLQQVNKSVPPLVNTA